MKPCAIYCRISRDRVGAGLGVDRQEQECRELAARLGLTVAAVYVDNDLSAYSGKPRPEYLRMLADVEAGAVGAVLAWHTDRLHRSPVELETYISACEKRDVPTYTVKAGPLDLSTPSGRLVARQLGAVARYEVEHQIERQQAAKRQAAVAGKWAGGRRPFGYDVDGVTVRPDEAAVIVEVTDAVLLGTSLRSLVAKLNARGCVTSTGRPWTPTELKRLLLRPRNAGLREHRGEVIGKAEWPAVVDVDKWRAARSVLTDPDRRTSPADNGRRWLLSGIARCGAEDCGATMQVTQLSSNNKTAVPSYSCKVRKCTVRNAAELEDYVTRVVLERLSRPDAVDLLRPSSPGVDVRALTIKETELRQRLDDLAADLTTDERTLALRAAALNRRLDQIRQEKADAARGSVFDGIIGAGDVAAAWESFDLGRKRSIIDTLISIVILRTSRGRPKGWRPGDSYFNPESILITWK